MRTFLIVAMRPLPVTSEGSLSGRSLVIPSSRFKPGLLHLFRYNENCYISFFLCNTPIQNFYIVISMMFCATHSIRFNISARLSCSISGMLGL
jgi:hypothetical protein